MKDSKEYSKKVASFFKKYKNKTVLKPFESENKVDSLVYSVLYEHLKTEDVESFVTLMRGHFVDWNDLRVSRLEEIVDVLSASGLPVEDKRKVSHQLVICLNSLFTKYDRISFEDIEELGKRQAHQELETLEGFTPFVVNFLMLNFKGSHSLPLNLMMVEYAKKEGLVHPSSSYQEISSFLERQITVDDIYSFYLILRQMCESPELAKSEKTAAKSAAGAKKPAPAKKTPVKKAPAKAKPAKIAPDKAKSKPASKKAVAKPAVKKTEVKKADVKTKVVAKKTTAKKAAPKKAVKK